MYDTLTSTYTFSCPIHGETRVCLSRFRRLEQLPGAQHPAVYRVEFACGCGSEHPGLVSHDELDWAPLGLRDETKFVNLMTSKLEAVAGELSDVAAARIKAGEWPWSFFCWPEERPRPVYPVGVQIARAGCVGRSRRPRRALPRVREDLGQPRVARARRRAVRERPRGGGGRARLRARRRGEPWRNSAPSSSRSRSTRAVSDLSDLLPSRQGSRRPTPRRYFQQ